MMKKSKLEWLWDGHKKPTNRRDFMAKSALSAGAYMFTPSILQLLWSTQGFAAEDSCEPPASGLPGYITINLSGGGGQATSYMGLDVGRQPLSSYSKSGIPNATSVTREFQGVAFPMASPFIAGLRVKAAAATRTNTAFIATLTPSRDDRNDNLLDASGLVAAAGLSGTLLPKLGTASGEKAGIGQASAVMAPPSPLIVTRMTDLTGAIGIVSPSVLATKLNTAQRTQLLGLVSKLSASQGRAIASVNSSSGTTLSKLIACATGKNLDLSSTADAGIDPTLATNPNNARLQAIWDFTTNTNLFGRSLNQRRIFGSLVYNTLIGKAGAAGLELGGHDFHDGTRTTGDTMMNEVGQLVGAILETAAQLNQRVVIHIVADGSTGTSGAGTDAVFVSDRGDGGMTYMLAYDPTRAATAMVKNDSLKHQLGDYTDGEGSDANNADVGTAEKASVATFANYLQFAGKYDTLMDQVLPRQYTTAQADRILRFG